MKITEKQIAELEKCRMDFLWKVQILEAGLLYNEQEEKVGFLHKRVKEMAECNFDISEKSIMQKEIENMDDKRFAYELGRYIESITREFVRETMHFNYPLDAIWSEFEEQVRKIFL